MARKSLRPSILQRQTKEQAAVVYQMLQSQRFLDWYNTKFVPECVEEHSPEANQRAIGMIQHYLQQAAGILTHP